MNGMGLVPLKFQRSWRNRARSVVAVGSWPLEFDIEIECVALA